MYNHRNKLYQSYWRRVFDSCIITAVTLLILQVELTAIVVVSSSSYDQNGRYSYSLTTFDPTGKLGQVERAIEASQLGTPIITVIYNTTNEYGIIMVAPQTLPNLFTLDDGTSRFTLISCNIMIAHSGLSSDGRILVSAAHKLAIQHEYTFDETIPIHILLEELSLLYQEYTMKVATRPFGTTLIVAYVPENSNSNKYFHTNKPQPAMYRIDPSGNVELLEDCAIIHGREQLQETDLVANLKVLMNDTSTTTIEECQDKVVKLVRDALKQQDTKLNRNNKNDDDDTYDDVTILTAALSRSISNNNNMIQNEGIFRKQRYEPDCTVEGH
jgi:20S proteasome alpha/beta subunit